MAGRINTPFTRLLNIAIPIVSAPMAFASTADLAGAVSGAGALGFIGAGFSTSEELKHMLQTVRTQLHLSSDATVPVGIGFLGWILDKTEDSPDPRLNAILEECPVAIWFAFGADLGKYVARVRAYEGERHHKTLVFVIVSSVEDALRAADEWEVDVIVVQGIEAGGHGASDAPPLLTLLQAVLHAVPSGPPILAAGGISSGSQITALLTMGAAGVVLGTRFLFTHECIYSRAKKDVLLKADLHATARSLAFDEVGRTMGWPPKHDGRAIANDILRDLHDGLDLDERLRRFDESAKAGDESRLVVWAGVGVGLTDEIDGAAAVVDALLSETVKSLVDARGMLG